MIFEYTKENRNPLYALQDGRYMYNGSMANYTGPVHGSRAGALFYDGHATMVDMESEFNCADTGAAQALWKKYFHSREIL
jgi:prepilin-type processing-associated H-X9-DG protein